MLTEKNRADYEELRARIAASPEKDRADLQEKLDSLLRSLQNGDVESRSANAQHDAELEALFDNMPV